MQPLETSSREKQLSVPAYNCIPNLTDRTQSEAAGLGQ
jgi:hypothetical protein